MNTAADLNDPNNTNFPVGIIGNDSKFGFRLSGSDRLPYEIMFAGSIVSNQGYPFRSTVNVTRARQTVSLSSRGDERLDNVTSIDLRVGRRFRFAGHSFSPQIDVFNITNTAAVTSVQNAVGSTYLDPREILSPRIIRVGFSLDF